MLVEIVKLNQSQYNQQSVKMAAALPFLGPALWSAGSAVATGIASYFLFRSPDKSGESESKIDSRGEIQNNVHLAVQENNQQNETLVSLLVILVSIKIFEVIMYTLNTIKKNMKKKYIKQYEQRERPAVANV